VLVYRDKIRRGREGTGLSQEKFAAEHGFSLKQVRLWESNDNARVQLDSLKRLAEALEVTPKSLIREANPPTLVSGQPAVMNANIEIATSATEMLYATGHRSRDLKYLAAIETALKNNPSIVHYRILFGTPHSHLYEHLKNLFLIRNPPAFRDGVQTMGIGLWQKAEHYPLEASICLNESRALLVLPSINAPWGYDTAVIFDDPRVIQGWRSWVEVMYRSAAPIENIAALKALGYHGTPQSAAPSKAVKSRSDTVSTADK
jgi:transcriptional regulator with XRE-family HTH domain